MKPSNIINKENIKYDRPPLFVCANYHRKQNIADYYREVDDGRNKNRHYRGSVCAVIVCIVKRRRKGSVCAGGSIKTGSYCRHLSVLRNLYIIYTKIIPHSAPDVNIQFAQNTLARYRGVVALMPILGGFI